MTHLSMLEIADEVDRLVDPSAAVNDRDAGVVAHLRDCATCRGRVNSLHEQDMQLARVLEVEAERVAESASETDVSAQVAAMMNRLRADVKAERQAKEARREAAIPEAPQVKVRGTIRPLPTRFRGATIGVLSFAAGLGVAVVGPALRTLAMPGASAVALVASGQETMQDSVPSFEEKQYTQKVGAGSEVNLVVQGISPSDFDCELYDPKQGNRIAVDDGKGGSCRFSIVASDAGQYRLVVKNKMGAPTSYMMVAQVKGQAGAGGPIEASAIPGEPLHQIQ